MARRGGMLVMGVISLLSVSGVVVVAVSSQSAGARSAYASVLQGRRLTGIAESAVAEAQGELTRLLGNGAGEGTLTVTPRRTRELIAKEYPGSSVGLVRIRRLPYESKANLGEIELAATATTSTLMGRRLRRTVVQRHFVSLGMDKQAMEVSEVAHRYRVDCEGE